MKDIFDQDWPDETETAARRKAFAASQLERLLPISDPLATEVPGTALEGQRAAKDDFWRRHEDRSMSDRLGLHSRDQRIHPQDAPIWEVGDADGRDD